MDLQDTLPKINEILRHALLTAFPSLPQDQDPMVKPTQDLKWGDYQCNAAMPVFKQLKGTEGCPTNPMQLAEKIKSCLPTDDDVIGKVEIAKPGIINIFLSDKFLRSYVVSIETDGAQPPKQAHKTVVMDYSSPNIAKEMHVGHLRSTILGDSMARILEYCGHTVKKINHVGDWGTQFGMLIRYIKEHRAEWLNEDFSSNNVTVSELMKLYKDSKKKFDENPDFKKASQEEVVQLQKGDATNIKLWTGICKVSERAFQEVYDILDVKGLVVRGESYYNPKLEETVDELIQKGVAVESKNAWVVDVPGTSCPMMVKKSDGGYNYSSTDMAAIKQRIEEEKGDWLIYFTDAGQGEHFKQVFYTAEKVGWWDKNKVRIDHVGFGVVLNKEGKRIRTRDTGEAIRLIDLINEGLQKAREAITEHNREGTLSENEIEDAVRCVGVGAIKYFDLRNNRTTSYKFDFDQMLSLNGNTAVYMMYAYVRIKSIGRKFGEEKQAEVIKNALSCPDKLTFGHQAESELIRMMLRYQEVVEACTSTLTLHLLCDYLYKLAGKFTSFHRDCKVIGSDEQDSRLVLCDACATIMKKSMELLGIQVPEKL